LNSGSNTPTDATPTIASDNQRLPRGLLRESVPRASPFVRLTAAF
jgi:hypothetical protein